jgi:drug/metabolite transporter (DMT)-like permease
VIAVGIGIAWAGERIDLAAAIGAVVVVGAVVLVARSQSALRPRTRCSRSCHLATPKADVQATLS